MSSSTIKPIVSVILSHKSRIKCLVKNNLKYNAKDDDDNEPKIVKLIWKGGDILYRDYLLNTNDMKGGSSCSTFANMKDINNTYSCVDKNEGIKNIQRENTATKSQKKLITEEEQEANNSHEKSNLDRFISTYSPSKK